MSCYLEKEFIMDFDNKYLKIEISENITNINSIGDWRLENEKEIEKELRDINLSKNIVWDLSHIKSFDSVGILLFIIFYEKFSKKVKVTVTGYTQEQKKIYDLLKENYSVEIFKEKREGILFKIGKIIMSAYYQFTSFLNFLGYIYIFFLRYFIKPSNFRYKETMYHIQRSGINAIFIIMLTSFLVGLVISYQSAVELAKFGADIFIVDMAGISITRELSPMITAIVVAGRSGSAYTAQIGAMKITEEISAMRTMGFDPYYFLVLPRVIALMISLPLLIFFADIIGIMGSMFASKMELSISYTQFIDRLQEVLPVKDFWIGIIKGPIFAILIATIGCFRGLQVSNNTESIGSQTTASVVNSIFFVIAFDALISILLTQWGI